MEIYKNHLEDFMYFHQELRAKYIKELSSLPDGKLIGYKSGSTYQYYHAYTANGQYERKGIGKDKHLISLLARKEYLTRALSIIDHNTDTLTAAFEHYTALTPKAIIDKMSSIYKSLPQNYFIDKISEKMPEEMLTWMNADFVQSTYKPHLKVHTTSRGLKVRTKSELLIAEMLYRHDIAFRYEQVIYANHRRYAPDFTILRLDGRIMYWEHFGMTHDQSYLFRNMRKLNDYQIEGIVPWKNFIATYDNDAGNIDLRIAESEIRNKLLNFDQ